VSIDCAWLDRHGYGLRGCLSVYEGESGFLAVNDPDARLPDSSEEGLPLVGEEGVSLPPDIGVFAHGSAEFQRWWNEEVEPLPGDERLAIWGPYEDEFRRSCPLYEMRNVVAVVGGWHINWHDDRPLWPGVPNDEVASYPCGENRLVLWTFRDAEPWVEVWLDTHGKLHAWGLIT
jgi:hypothetical protein